jgi:hypothetical protein
VREVTAVEVNEPGAVRLVRDPLDGLRHDPSAMVVRRFPFAVRSKRSTYHRSQVRTITMSDDEPA